MLVTQALEIHRSQIQGGERTSKRRKIDPAGAVLAVDHLLFLHVKGDNRKFADARVARAMVRRIETSAVVSSG